MRLIILFFFLIFCNQVFSQSQIIDKDIGIPVTGILIYNTDNRVIDITNKKGFFKVKEDSIRIKNILYGDTIIKNERKIYLKRKIYTLQEIEVKDTIPILVRLKNAFINSKNSLPKDTVLYYGFEIKNSIKRLNWNEKAEGIFRVDIDEKNRVRVFICDGYSYHRDSIDVLIYMRVPSYFIEDYFRVYEKGLNKMYKTLRKNIKRKRFYFSQSKKGDVYEVTLFNSKDTIKYMFNKFIYSISYHVKHGKLMYLIKASANVYNKYFFKNGTFYMNEIKTQDLSQVKAKEELYSIDSGFMLYKLENVNCSYYYKFNGKLSLDLMFRKMKKYKAEKQNENTLQQ